MKISRSYWVYSVGLAVVWAAILIGVAAKRTSDKLHTVLLIFAGFAICWVSGTIRGLSIHPRSGGNHRSR